MNYRSIKVIIFLAGLLLTFPSVAQKTKPPFLRYMNHPWVDSVFNTLSERERIAQLIWVAAFSNRGISHEVYLSDQIRQNGIGGIIFFQDQPVRQTEMINYFRDISKVPLIVVTDGEWGIGMRLNRVVKFPFQMTLGAIRDDSLIYRMGKSVASQFKRAGVQVNLAPVADVVNNPQNPVIGYRSFGEYPANVTRKVLMYMNGLQDNGIISVAKHFPGHGDTEIDSHFDQPVIRQTKERLDSVELVPFRALIDAGVSGIMPGHLNIPAIDSTPNLPATLSYPLLTGLLRNELSFRGLTLSDAMNMGGVTNYPVAGGAEVTALKAGMDVLEYVEDPLKAINSIDEAVKKGVISREAINEKCRKVLVAKYWAGLNHSLRIDTARIEEELSLPSAKALIRELYASALTLLSNNNNIIPVTHLENVKIATIAINSPAITLFQERLSSYHPSDNYFITTADSSSTDKLIKKLSGYDLVIAGVYGLDQRPANNFGVTPWLNSLIDTIVSGNRTVVSWFGNPYSIARVSSLKKAVGLILAYQENSFTEDLSAQLIFGAIGAKGSSPVTINEKWPYGYGIITPGNLRMQYGIPESAGVSSVMLEKKIDSIAGIGIADKAFPGCEVMIARKGIVIFRKTYGYQTYDDRTILRDDDLFDLASVTKVSSTLAGLMLLDSEGKFSPDHTLGEYLPYFKHSNKGDLKMADILTHQAGLKSWIPFWKESVRKNGDYKKRIYRSQESEKYPLEVASGLYITDKYRKKIFSEIKRSPLGEQKYLYSDLGFIILPSIIENLTGEKWYDFVTSNIYHKLGAYNIVFNPSLKYPLSRIVPTEYDSLFRKQLLHGTVHDEGAAMLGGISGHAGLFATSNDLMKLVEMYRRMGSYGGEQVISREVLQKYTSVQFPENNNKRGLGFDKPSLNNARLSDKEAYPAKSASPSGFGHSGFTGTFIWVDPDYEISYIFLSNRVYPTRENNLITTLNIRTSILQAIYDSIIK